MSLQTQPTSGSRVAIQPATWRDFNAIRHLEQVCFPQDAWPFFDILGVLTFPKVIRLKAVVGEKLVGFVACDPRPTQNLAWIATIGVLPAYRRQGIASTLIQTCEEQIDLPAIRLTVRASNRNAINLYYELGYEQVGLWLRYYPDKENALVFEKRISANNPQFGL